MICENCGKTIEDNVKFCPECGNKIVISVEEKPPTEEINWYGLWFTLGLFVFGITIPLFMAIGEYPQIFAYFIAPLLLYAILLFSVFYRQF